METTYSFQELTKEVLETLENREEYLCVVHDISDETPLDIEPPRTKVLLQWVEIAEKFVDVHDNNWTQEEVLEILLPLPVVTMQQEKKPLSEKEHFSDNDLKIKNNIYIILNKLGASADVLAVIGSWKDTQDDEIILDMIQALANDESIWKNVICERKEVNPKDN